MGKYQASRDLVRAYFQKLEKCAPEQTADVLNEYMAEGFSWEGVYPFLYQTGASDVAKVFWKPLKESLRHMQRRQDVFMAGTCHTDGKTWVMSMGQFMGLFDKDFLGVRCTYKMQHLQYFEYNCVEDGKITRSAIFVDLLGFMKEAGQYPLMAETGTYFTYPGPRDHNGLHFTDAVDEAAAQAKADETFDIVLQVSKRSSTLAGMQVPPLDYLRYDFAEDMIWYGPCGVGASYTIPRYQVQHRSPYREFNSDVKGADGADVGSYFAEGDFVCFFIDMALTPGGGWLGMPGSNRSIFLHADLDVYYVKDGKISENWCFFDIPHWLSLQGVDVFKRACSIIDPPADLLELMENQ